MLKRILFILILLNSITSGIGQRRYIGFDWDGYGQYFSPYDSLQVFDSINQEITISYYNRWGKYDSLGLRNYCRIKKLDTGLYRLKFNRNIIHFRKTEYWKFDSSGHVWESNKRGKIKKRNIPNWIDWLEMREIHKNTEGMDSVVFVSKFIRSGADTIWYSFKKHFYKNGDLMEKWYAGTQNKKCDFKKGNYYIEKYGKDSSMKRYSESYRVDSNNQITFNYRSYNVKKYNKDGKLEEFLYTSEDENRVIIYKLVSKYFYQGNRLVRIEEYENGILEELTEFEISN